MTPEQLARSGTEDAHQMAVFAWAALEVRNCPQLRWLHSVPNGGLRSARTGAKMKATGARKGVLDICLPVPVWSHLDGRVQYTGLYIEMKKEKPRGTLTKEQKEYIEHLKFYHYEVQVCYTWIEAVSVISQYIVHIPQSERDKYKERMDA